VKKNLAMENNRRDFMKKVMGGAAGFGIDGDPALIEKYRYE